MTTDPRTLPWPVIEITVDSARICFDALESQLIDIEVKLALSRNEFNKVDLLIRELKHAITGIKHPETYRSPETESETT